MRIINFVDGASSETTPTIGNISASDLVKYTDDAAYEASEVGTPIDGNIYYNTTTDKVRVYIDGVWTNLADELWTQTALDLKQDLSEKSAANGYASLDGTGKVPAAELPSYVDDVIEVADFASLPGTGETGKIYVTIDDNKTFRWTGSVYVEVGPSSQASNQNLIEGGNWDLVLSGGASADTIEQTASESSGLSLNQDFYIAQTITPATSFTVNKASFKMYNPGIPLSGNWQMEIWGTLAGGNPDSTNVIAVSNTFDASTVPITVGTSTQIEFTFPTPPTLSSSIKYTVVLNPTGSTGAYTARHSDNSDPYVGGDFYYSNNPASTSWSKDSNSDLVFIVTQDAVSATPELTWDTDAYIQQEGFDKTRNTLVAASTSFAGSNDIAYITVNKDTDVVTNLTVNTAELALFAPGEDDLIIYRLLDNGVEVGRKLYLNDGESATIEAGITPSAGGTNWADPVDASIVPDTDVSENIGSVFKRFFTGFFKQLNVSDLVIRTGTNAASVGSELIKGNNGFNVTLETAGDATVSTNATPNVYLTSGNKSNGIADSGDIISRIGTASGNRGKIRNQDGTEGTAGHFWKSADTTGGGEWVAPNKLQTKILTTDITTVTTISDLTFNNLVIGKEYQVTGNFNLVLDGAISDSEIIVDTMHDGVIINRCRHRIAEATDTSDDAQTKALSFHFTATATVLTFVTISGSTGSYVEGSGASRAGTYVQVEERNNLVITTDFT